MLVMQRKVGQRLLLRIGYVEVWIGPMSVRGGETVRLGIEAPREVIVLREELVAGEPPPAKV